MAQVVVSSKYQIVIPKDVRSHMHIAKGQKFNVICKGEIIHLIPVRPVKDMMGFLSHYKIPSEREDEDRV